MDFWKAVLSLARNRYIGPPVIVLALVVGGFAYSLAPTHYVASAFMVLTTPTGGGSLDPEKPDSVTNPLLQFNDGLKTTAGILIQAMNTPQVGAAVGAPEAGTTKIQINDGSTNPNLLGTSTTGPFIYIQVDSLVVAEARDTVLRAQKYLRDDLASRQKKLRAPQSTFIMITDVVPPTAPEVSRGGKWQAALVALVLCLVVGFGGAYFVSRIRKPRQAAVPMPEAARGRPEAATAYRPAAPTAPASAQPAVASRTGAEAAASTSVDEGPPDWDSEDTQMFVVVIDDGTPQQRDRQGRDDDSRDQGERPIRVLRGPGQDKPRTTKGDATDRIGDITPRAG